ncbi:primosomal protein N' [Polymorphobacter multimanifer]|uniref:primosomal protein N' n=1 Tax=Polymorphobacter multimanifer TaxID=1070431 RepID=UPI00166B67A2|nr:primosomal protein N' [Polymorphobacter multimanifer]
MAEQVRVVVMQAGLGPLDYAMPAGQSLEAGQAVLVPLGPRQIMGVVWDGLEGPAFTGKGLRAVAGVLPLPLVPEPLRRLCDWVADYYLASLAGVLRMVLPSVAALGERQIVEYRLSGTQPPRLTPERSKALAALEGRAGTVRDLARAADVSEAVIRGLVNVGVLAAETVPAGQLPAPPDPDFAPPALEPAQADAARALTEAVAAGGFAPFLLEGVTGSGKTEVYAEAIAAALRAGGQALVLLPEIALTAAFTARLAARFGSPPVAWHSDLKTSERRAAYAAIADGRARLVVGARSALFLPFKDLRLTIVDEAHETSFKQEDGVHYHARDVAVMRAQFEGATVVLASATPAIETRVQAERGTYRHLLLPARFGGAAMPDISAVDLRKTPPVRGRWIAPPLAAAISETLARAEQALLFLHRRGHAPLTLCRARGEKINCPNCTAWMVEHRLPRRLACHHCGHEMTVPPACPSCGEPDTLVACGPGVERIAEEVAATWGAARIALVTSDTITSPARAAALVAAVEGREIDILIGTQLVTKGFHFPELTLVGVIDADLGLSGGDLRASERTFAQIAQVAGRAGRSAKPGRVLLQTHQPEARLMQALIHGDAAAFYAHETATRRDLTLPPFGRLAALIVSSEKEPEARAAAQALAEAAPARTGLQVLGPAPAPLAMLRGRHRFRLLVTARRTVPLSAILRDWLVRVPLGNSVRVVVDVDPYSFM